MEKEEKSDEQEDEEEEVEFECIERWWRRGAAEFGSLSGVGPPSAAQSGPTWPTATSFVARNTPPNCDKYFSKNRRNTCLNSGKYLLRFGG